MQGNYWEMVLLAPWDSDEVQECKVFPGGLDIGSECRRGSQDPHHVRNEKKTSPNTALFWQKKTKGYSVSVAWKGRGDSVCSPEATT